MKRTLYLLMAISIIAGLTACNNAPELTPLTSTISADSSNYLFHGRTFLEDYGLICDESATGLSFSAYMQGSVTVSMTISTDTYFTVYIDGTRQEERLFVRTTEENSVEIANFAKPGQHTIRLIKQTEACKSLCVLKTVSFNGYFTEKPAASTYNIAYIGDSITTGYGVYYNLDTDAGSAVCQDATISYAYLASQKLNADAILTCRSGIGVAAGHTGYMMNEYFTSQSYNRDMATPYVPTQTVDLVVINLGTNDAMGSNEKLIPKVSELIDTVRKTYGTDVPIVWMHGMMNDVRWAAIKSVIDSKYNGEQGGIYGLVLPETRDGGNSHPSLEAHENAADLLVDFIQSKGILSK